MRECAALMTKDDAIVALRKYVAHSEFCDRNVWDVHGACYVIDEQRPCTCGLADALAQTEVRELSTEDDERRLRDQVCPQCRKTFELVWNDYDREKRPQTLFLRGCPSGGIYDVSISCPHCDYEEEL